MYIFKIRNLVFYGRELKRHFSMDLASVVAKFEEYAPTKLAASWDNVGLLIEPSAPHCVKKILVTNDLTLPVMDEAVAKKVDLIFSYHPPLFSSFKVLKQASWKQRIAIRCIENRIAVYSPHTSFDAQKGSVNDWLISPFGEGTPIEDVTLPQNFCRVEVTGDRKHLEGFVNILVQKEIGKRLSISDLDLFTRSTMHGDEVNVLQFSSRQNKIPEINAMLRKDGVKTLFLPMCEIPEAGLGAGRLVKLASKITLQEAVDRMKSHLNMEHVRVAIGRKANLNSKVGKIAVCAGSGSSVLRGIDADLYITGEMSHHEVLDATQAKRSVILCDHSNTERGFLKSKACQELEEHLEHKIEVVMSEIDCDPLEIM